MIREVDLVSYLPPFLADYKELNITLTAEKPEFAIAWDASNRILYNQFISTADEYGISRYEKMLGIYPQDTDNLETRRMRVQSRWLVKVPYTIRLLTVKLVEILGGEHNFLIRSDFNKYELVLTIYTTNDSQTEDVKYLLSSMVPANITYDIIYETGYVGRAFFGAVMKEIDIIQIKQRQV